MGGVNKEKKASVYKVKEKRERVCVCVCALDKKREEE